jgi:hypothetical protein
LAKWEKIFRGKLLRFWLCISRKTRLGRGSKQKVKQGNSRPKLKGIILLEKGSHETCVKPKREFRKCRERFEIVLFFRSFLLSDIFA